MTNAVICEQIDKANERINSGNTDGFRSYEDGVKDALEWIIGNANPPMNDDDEQN